MVLTTCPLISPKASMSVHCEKNCICDTSNEVNGIMQGKDADGLVLNIKYILF